MSRPGALRAFAATLVRTLREADVPPDVRTEAEFERRFVIPHAARLASTRPRCG